MSDTFPFPPDGIVCFHCGDRFTTPGACQMHFGFEPSRDPACRIKFGAEMGLLMELRELERLLAEAWTALHDEGSEAVKAMNAMAARHSKQLIDAEEMGFARGLEQGRKLPLLEGPMP